MDKDNTNFFMDKDNTKKTEIKDIGRSMLELDAKKERMRQDRKLVIHGKITIILTIALLILGVLISMLYK